MSYTGSDYVRKPAEQHSENDSRCCTLLFGYGVNDFHTGVTNI